MAADRTMTNQAATQSGRQTLDSIQALRGIAACLVVLYHTAGVERVYAHATFQPLSPFLFFGAEGVDLFFVISGFIIVWTSFDSFEKPAAIPKYLARRAARIFPLYWIFFAFALLMGRLGLSHAVEGRDNVGNMISIFFLLPIECVHIVPVSWTLTFEFLFYCLFALALPFRRRVFPLFLLGWFLLVVAAAIYPPGASDPLSFVHRVANVVFHVRTIEFMFGCLVALQLKRKIPSRPLLWFGLGVLIFAAAGVRLYLRDPTAHISVWQSDLIVLFGLGSTAIVFGAVAFEARRGGTFVPRWLVKLGDASYALYLCHVFVLVAARRVLEPLNRPGPLWHLAWLLALLGSALVAGLLSYWFLEQPLLRASRRAINRYFGT